MITSLIKDEKEFERLPKSLQKAVKNPVALELLKNISADMSLSQEQENNFTDIVFSIIKGEVELYDCVSLISGVLEIEFDRALEINDRLYENLFFSIETDINDRFAIYQKTKAPIKGSVIKIEDIKKSQKEKSDFLPLIDKAVKKFNLFSSVIPAKAGIQAVKDGIPHQVRDDKEGVRDGTENLKNKFSEIADTFLSNVRTKSQFKNTLIKPSSEGGLGMEEKLADDVAEFFASYSRLQPVIAKNEAAKQLPRKFVSAPSVILSEREGSRDSSPLAQNDTGNVAQNDKIKIVPPNVKIEVSFEKEEKEVAAPPPVIPAKAGIQSVKNKEAVDFSREEKEAMAKKPKIEKMRIAAPKLLSVTEGVEKALKELNYSFPSSELQDRLKSIIDARVRSVRTSLQTFDKLTQEIPGGGLGFSKLEADRVSLVLNKYLEEKSKDIYGSKIAEIKQAEDEEKKKNEERARAAEEAERKNLDDRFIKMTGKAPPPLSVIPAEAGIQPPALTKKEIAEKKVASPPVIPKFIPAEAGTQGQYSGIQKNNPDSRLRGNDTGKGFLKSASPPAKPYTLNPTPSPRPVLEDIKFTPKLAGPTEEIARLTPDDFRKLSGDPKEAILKIKDKLQLLRGESYKKYQTGIDAWRNSSLYGEYLKIINKSLSEGVSLQDAIAAAGTLTKDEFDAIMESRIE